jgi:hypothetical protein
MLAATSNRQLNSHAELCKPPLRLKRLLYDPGDTASSMIHDDRRALRQVEAIPELRQFREWMGIDKDGIPFEDSTLHGLPLKRSLAKMIRYARASWKVLKVYTTHGRLTIDNDTVRSRCMAPRHACRRSRNAPGRYRPIDIDRSPGMIGKTVRRQCGPPD